MEQDILHLVLLVWQRKLKTLVQSSHLTLKGMDFLKRHKTFKIFLSILWLHKLCKY